MAENILTIPKTKRYPDGIVQKWSARRGRMVWGFDAYINDRRVRKAKYASRETAEHELRMLRLKGECAQNGLEVDEAGLDSDVVWQKFEALVECKIGAVGATAELLVAADLLRKGYDVYRAVASNSDCDLIVGRYNRLCRVEVKSAIEREGKIRFKTHRLNALAYDVLALCFLRDFRIEYRPAVEEWFGQTVE